jgi:hypothetical protein
MQNSSPYGAGGRPGLVEDAWFQGAAFALLPKPIPPAELLFEVGKMINGLAPIREVLADGTRG